MKAAYMKKLYEDLNNTSDDVRLELISNTINNKLNSALGIDADIDVVIDNSDIIVDAVDIANELHLVLGFTHDDYGDLLIISPYDEDLNNVADDMAGVIDLELYNPPVILNNNIEILDVTNLDWLPDEAIIKALPTDLTAQEANEAIKLVKGKKKLTMPLANIKENLKNNTWEKPNKLGFNRTKDNSGHTCYEKMEYNSSKALRNLPIITYRLTH